jgi:hypothetical protein
MRLNPCLEVLDINSPINYTAVVSLDAALRQPMTQRFLFIRCNALLYRASESRFQGPPISMQTMDCMDWVLSWAQEGMDKVRDQALPRLRHIVIYILGAPLGGVPGSTAECFERMLQRVSYTQSMIEMREEIQRALLLSESPGSNMQCITDLRNMLYEWVSSGGREG